MDRTVVVATLWFALWIAVGYVLAGPLELFGLFGGGISGAIGGFVFALFSTFAWPWLLPNFIWRWMDKD
jgi:hypothetical protein